MSKPQPNKSDVVPQVRAVTLSHFVEVVSRLGADPYRMLREVRIRPQDLTDPEGRLSAAAVVRLAEDAARETGCGALGLLLAEPRNFASLGPVSLLLQHRATVGASVESLIKHQRMLSDVIDHALDDDGETATIRANLLHGCASPQATEYAVTILVQALREMSGGRWRPDRIHFRHSAPADLRIHRRIFQVPVQFDSDFDGLTCRSPSLQVPNRAADELMARHAEHCLELLAGQRSATSVADQVRRAISGLIGRCTVTMESVADNLGLHPRMLQRLLEKEGATFASLLNEIRRELAARYLATSKHSVTDVGLMLGYATLSSFSRWFAVEFGKSPAAWRSAARGVPPCPRDLAAAPTKRAAGGEIYA